MRESIKKTLRRVGTVLVLTSPCLAQAQSETQCLSAEVARTFVYYANGIFEDRQRARKNGRLIRDAYKSLLEERYRNMQDPSLSEQFDFPLLYIPINNTLITAIMALFVGSVPGNAGVSVTAYSLFWALLGGASEIEGIPPDSVEELRSILIDLFLAQAAIIGHDSSLFLPILSTLDGNLREDTRVLLITHDQGILPVNTAVRMLLEERSRGIGVIAIAPLINTGSGNSILDIPDAPTRELRYITANDDEVIRKFRSVAVLPILPGNLDNNPGTDDTRGPLNHDFQDAYFAPGLSSRTLIDELIDAYFPGPGATNGILQPSNLTPLGSGPITVQLRWGNQPDADLHVYEPDDTHVYWRTPQPAGAAGFLDLVEDADGFGPEHYFVACDTIKVGTYRVGVNYYEGDGPETARVAISTGDGRTRTYRQVLPEERGEPGVDSPIPFATIAVARNASGAYSYIVRSSSE